MQLWRQLLRCQMQVANSLSTRSRSCGSLRGRHFVLRVLLRVSDRDVIATFASCASLCLLLLALVPHVWVLRLPGGGVGVSVQRAREVEHVALARLLLSALAPVELVLGRIGVLLPDVGQPLLSHELDRQQSSDVTKHRVALPETKPEGARNCAPRYSKCHSLDVDSKLLQCCIKLRWIENERHDINKLQTYWVPHRPPLNSRSWKSDLKSTKLNHVSLFHHHA